jgi:hypothetical protein
MSSSGRCEILLPLKFNNGQPVPWTLIGETLLGQVDIWMTTYPIEIV